MKYLRTTDLARAVGVHPNTVRRYVDWHLIPPVERTTTGYRLFTSKHLDCLRVARLIYASVYPGRGLRLSGGKVITCAVHDDWVGALAYANIHLHKVHAEQAQAETAAALLENWATGATPLEKVEPMQIGQVSRLLEVSIDSLRNWERNGLIAIPRDPESGYRLYGSPEIARLRVIRVLSRAGYSMMAILRMLLQFDRGLRSGLRVPLDTPPPDEDLYTAADRWLSTLAEQERVAQRLIALIEEIIAQRSASERPFEK